METDGQASQSPHSLEALLVRRHHLSHIPELLGTQRNKLLCGGQRGEGGHLQPTSSSATDSEVGYMLVWKSFLFFQEVTIGELKTKGALNYIVESPFLVFQY